MHYPYSMLHYRLKYGFCCLLVLSACAPVPVKSPLAQWAPSPNFDTRKPRLIVIHHTDMDSADATGAAVVLISACLDRQEASDGARNSKFTAELREVWARDRFGNSLTGFHEAIASRTPSKQTPKYFLTGKIDVSFQAQRPWAK